MNTVGAEAVEAVEEVGLRVGVAAALADQQRSGHHPHVLGKHHRRSAAAVAVAATGRSTVAGGSGRSIGAVPRTVAGSSCPGGRVVRVGGGVGAAPVRMQDGAPVPVHGRGAIGPISEANEVQIFRFVLLAAIARRSPNL